MIIALDTELNGLDMAFGARPFLVTICDEDGKNHFWEWPVDPYTRSVLVPPGDAEEIRGWVEDADEIVGQNLKIDAKALQYAGIVDEWPWGKSHDTLIAGHLLASGLPHNLTAMVSQYLGEDIKPFEEELREAVLDCRRKVASMNRDTSEEYVDDLFADGDQRKWHIAKKGDPTMPSADDAWHFDYWLPRAWAEHSGYADDHPYRTVCSRYANADSAYTLLLWRIMERELRAKGLWNVYKESMRLPRIIADMETRGVSYNLAAGEALIGEYADESQAFGDECREIAKQLGYDLELPKGATNNSLKWFAFGYDRCRCRACGHEFNDHVGKLHECKDKRCKSRDLEVTRCPGLDLPAVSSTETGPSLNKEAFDIWDVTLEGVQLQFVRSLAGKRKDDTAIQYLHNYKRFGVPVGEHQGRTLIHSSINQTGTAHLRHSSNDPNLQNVSKQLRPCVACGATGERGGHTCRTCKGEGEVNYNLRRPFQPLPGREFWAMDYENIELKIPAYYCGERLMIELFEKSAEPPFYGSQHLLNASIVYPELFWPLADHKGAFKKKYASTEYTWIKGFDFALSYQCGEATGDRAARRKGAWRKVKEAFKELDKLAQRNYDFAKKHGYVELIPDKSVDPHRGYTIMTSRSRFGDLSPTIPHNYWTSGNACWAKRRAMVRCQEQLNEWNAEVLLAAGLYDAAYRTRRKYLDVHGYHMSFEIHDELLFDFPAGGVRNLARATRLRQLMERSGDDISIPLTVAMSWHPRTWAESDELFPKEKAA